jgi:hypothetical protein
MAEIDGQVVELEGEVLAEEDADFDPDAAGRVTVLAERWQAATNLPVLKDEVRTAALAVAGGALAGAATVAAVRAVGGAGRSSRGNRRLRRRARTDNVIATRSFLVDVHLLGR